MASRWRQWTAFGIGGGAALAMAAMSQACTVIVSDAAWDGGVGDAAPAEAAIPDAQPTSPACNACLVDACQAQWSLCTSSSDCMAIYTCATAPSCASDNACVATCYNAHPKGQPLYDGLSGCDSNAMYCSCAGTCGVDASSSCTSPEAGADAGDSGDAAPQTCAACAAQSCGAESAACGSGSACEAYTKCLAGCADAACVDKCATDNAQGKQDSDKLASCLSQNCAAPCGLQ